MTEMSESLRELFDGPEGVRVEGVPLVGSHPNHADEIWMDFGKPVETVKLTRAQALVLVSELVDHVRYVGSVLDES
jgi:hypothetical protein